MGRALVGSESTLVTILQAELRLVPAPPARSLVVLGYPDIASAADAVPHILPHQPEQLEGVDNALITVERQRRMNPKSLQLLPEGNGWLMVIFAADSKDAADAKAQALISDLEDTDHEPTVRLYDDPELEQELADVREVALGATARMPGMPPTWEGWEDSAVPPDRLGDYLRELLKLYDEFGYSGSALYGHFGQGCVHTRIPFDLVTDDGIATFRRFIERAADLVVTYGGSFSGEHGDGQSRAELLPRLFGDEVVEAFGQFKAIFDPDNRMNPGKLVAPYKLDENLRLGASWAPRDYDTFFHYPDDDGRFENAVMRCVGVGKCRHADGGVMCPSYMVTREEEHSTRGRSRLLFEMLEGHADSPVKAGWRSTEVRDALDLCLACKGCKRDCPVEVDMATMKAEFMAHHYQGRLRPRAHYSMGWLPAFAQLASRAPRLVNALSQAPVLRDALTTAGGIDRRRRVPLFAGQTFQAWHAGRERQAGHAGRADRLARRGRPLAGHVHQPFRAGRRAGRRRGPGVGRLAGDRARAAALLRADLDFDRPAGHRPASAGADGRRARALPARRREGRRPGAELHGRFPQRRGRAHAGRPRRPATARPDRHPGRVAAPPHRRVAATAGRRSGDRADPLPPARHHGLRRRQGAAGRRRPRR